MDKLLDYPIPHDDQTERAVLGALLYDPSNVDTVINILKPEDFYNLRNKIVYEAILDLVEEGKILDPIVLKNHLEKLGKLESIGGENYITLLLQDAAPQSALEILAQNLKEKSIARGLIDIAKDILIKSKTVRDINELIEETENRIFKLSEEKSVAEYYSLGDLLKETLNIINELSKKETLVTGLASGFYELDRLTTGFHNGDLIIIAARPAMGKTAFALSILYNVSVIEQKPSAFFSLEMSRQQIAMRLLCQETRIPLRKVRSGFLTKDELEKLTDKALKMVNAPIYIDDTASLSILDLRAKARKLKREKDIQLIVIDYLQLMRSSRRVESRQQEVAEISRGLKGLAKDLNIPVIALAQLSRQTELRSDKRPQLADLRESGSIEQDADLVMFIHRPEYYKKNPTPEEEGIAEIIIAKQRNGPTGTIKLAFIKDITRFENLAKDYYQNIEESENKNINQDKSKISNQKENPLEYLNEEEIPFNLEEDEIVDM
ncbi:replicative DNA helicase [Hydrogenothermus marinus]|uniref:Replicative DNA helicase n=1 Tax=Hydrogenothermus marinus TaxID=133270 RepID=A0A3M0B7Y1_9AQUI|nr:replicative DNA helicase [Hydrogenothermus marinus]RMA92564.1 replicative DNA helicase [Hydrogenothermus marinus]